MIKFILIFLFTLPLFDYAQSDSLNDKIKSVREKIFFLNPEKQNHKLFSSEGDYGHHGFLSPDFTTSRFESWWYDTEIVHYLNYYREYNIYKKLVKETWYNKKDVSIRNFVYQYDDNQNLLQEKETYPTGFDAVINYHFNDEDLLESSLKYFSDPGFFYYDDYIYDDQKRLIEIKSFNHDGELSGKKFTYNPNRKLVKLFEHSPYILVPSEGKSILSKRDKEGQDLLNEEYSYTEFDSISEIKYYKQDFVDPNKRFLYKKVIYNYDTQKRKAVEYHYSLESLLSTVNFKYYPGNLIEETNYSSVNNSSTYKYFYNKDGFISKVIFVTNKKTTILEFKYVFDQNNNWIQQEKSVDNVELYRRTRDIEYYSAKMN